MGSENIEQLNNSIAPAVTTNYVNNGSGMQIGSVNNLNLTIEESINALDALLAGVPKPQTISPPEEITPEEDDYIQELYRAYGDAEGVEFSEDMLEDYEDYKDDLDTRRIDYFSAESIRVSIDALDPSELRDQFSVLKKEVYDAVESTYRRRHTDGYDRMLAVMDTAANAPVEEYLLKRVPHWINNKIKKGVCHFLVIDGRLKWVKRRNGKNT